MTQDGLKRLYRLRELRKEKALEKVTARQAALRRAEHELIEAQNVLEDHLQATLQQEASGLSGMVGKTLSHAEIFSFRSELMLLIERLAALMAEEKTAGQMREMAKAELKAATAVFRDYHRSAEKLDHVIVQGGRKLMKKRLALSEAIDDELQNRRRVSKEAR
ncbi:MAG: hypothetical protein WBP94_06225 [Rhodomicrobiaceae bacterium]